ncbi:ATP-binding protein [Nitriliruptor alkaliphilus]|uniref:ATP-binding protein n=1 Tax=Nitriliruptor alkaliphilus TaxID=427918 RepID=UPI0006980BD2|nr:ATP-binding protein [Nitriliruptor alkaliphilus]
MSEGHRLESLRRLGLRSGAPEAGVDDLVDLLRLLAGADTAALTLVDAARAWPMASAGVLPAVALERSRSAADLVLPIPEGLLWVDDAASHARLGGHPWVRTEPGVVTLAAATVTAPDGQPIGALELGWCQRATRTGEGDATIRRAAAQVATRLELRAEAVEYRRFVELAPDAMAVLDLDGAIELGNTAFADLLGHASPEALRGRPFLDLVVPEHRDRGAADLARVLFARQRVSTIDLTLQRPDGARLQVAISAGHLRGPRRSLQLVVRDLSERVRAEAERAHLTEQLAEAHRFETVGQLAGGLAHDLNNLLAVLVSNLQLAEETLQDLREGGDLVTGFAAMADDLGHLRSASDRVDVLTRKLLQFASRADVHVGPIRLADVAGELHGLLDRTLGPAVTLDVVVDDDVPDVEVDPGELEQTITNLLLNGRDAMPGGGRLTLRIRGDQRPGREGGPSRRVAVIEVADEGTGMSEAVLARAFEPLFTTKSADKGTGLGLASVQAFIQRAGGTVHVDTAPDEGTRFTLVLPAAGTEPEVTRPAAEAAPLVLLVDPAERSRRIIAAMFEQAGYRVEEVADAATARARLSSEPPAVLACEIALPDATGPAVVVAARVERSDLAAVLLSSNPDVRDQIAGIPVLVKPFSSERLLETVAAARADVGAVDHG